MTKKEIIDSVAKQSGVTKAVATTMVESFINTIIDGVKDGYKVNIVGFGAFECKESKAGERRNPKTGEMVKVDAKKSLKFKASKKIEL